MQIQTQITVDLNRPGIQTVPAMQHDAQTRAVAISLLCDGQPWQPPEGVTAAIGFERPDRTRGVYDRLADGTAAITISDSVATVLLTAEVLSVPGCVRACLVFHDENLNQLSTFPFRIQVQVNPAAEAPQMDDYCRLQWLQDKLDEYLTLAKDSGEFNGPVPTLLGQEVDFQISSDYRQIPTGQWEEALPACPPGEYVWSRTTAHYDSGDVVSYSVSRNGVDGDGALISVCGVGPDENGNVPLTAEDVGALSCVGGAVQGQIDMGGQKLTGLPDPTEDTDAAGKGYVDAQAAAAVTAAGQAVKTSFVTFFLDATAWEGSAAPNGGIASLNHYSKGAVCRWLFDTMCGIRVDGENHFTIAPRPGGHFTYAKARYDSVYGRVESGWEKTERGYSYTVRIPSNTIARICLPDGTEQQMGAGRHTIDWAAE